MNKLIPTLLLSSIAFMGKSQERQVSFAKNSFDTMTVNNAPAFKAVSQAKSRIESSPHIKMYHAGNLKIQLFGKDLDADGVIEENEIFQQKISITDIDSGIFYSITALKASMDYKMIYFEHLAKIQAKDYIEETKTDIVWHDLARQAVNDPNTMIKAVKDKIALSPQ